MSYTFDREFEEREDYYSGGMGGSGAEPAIEPETLGWNLLKACGDIASWSGFGFFGGAAAGYLLGDAETGCYIGAGAGGLARAVLAYFDIKYFILKDRQEVEREFEGSAEPETGNNPLGDELVERFREHLDNVGKRYEG